jgi:hypothetical protein
VAQGPVQRANYAQNEDATQVNMNDNPCITGKRPFSDYTKISVPVNCIPPSGAHSKRIKFHTTSLLLDITSGDGRLG